MTLGHLPLGLFPCTRAAAAILVSSAVLSPQSFNRVVQDAVQGARGAQVPHVQQVGVRGRGEVRRRLQVPQGLLQVL